MNLYTGEAMEEFSLYPESVYYIYRQRSCRNCEKFPEDCTAFNKRTSKAFTCDRARCGCRSYAGPYEDERPFKKQILK